ncbi:hypothetical protein L6R50_20730 [Myxococcota bacterium]|nr:hypothetical protein [Myxococcota bacterium]
MRWGVRTLRLLTLDQCRLLKEKGIDWVRIPLPWSFVERRRGQRDWAPTDRWLSAPLESGLSVLGIVGEGFAHATPAWVEGEGGIQAPDHARRLADYVSDVVSRYPAVRGWQVEECLNGWAWEVLGSRRRKGRGWADAATRLRLLREAAEAVRRADAGAKVHVTVTADLPGWRRSAAEWRDAGLRIDVLGLSLFPCRVVPLPSLASRVGEAVHAAREIAGIPEIEISATGFPTHRDPWTHARQREYLAGAAREAREAGAAGFFVSHLRDQAHDDPELGYWMPDQARNLGIWRYDGTPKAAFDELRVVIREDRYG